MSPDSAWQDCDLRLQARAARSCPVRFCGVRAAFFQILKRRFANRQPRPVILCRDLLSVSETSSASIGRIDVNMFRPSRKPGPNVFGNPASGSFAMSMLTSRAMGT